MDVRCGEVPMSRRVLVVDDTELNRKLAVAILKREGWHAEDVASGEEALVSLSGDHGYDVVLLDIRMPGMSGEEVCAILRADPHTATLPVIAYTAHALEDEVDGFIERGFNAVLIKPISLVTLMDILNKTLGISA